MVLFVWGNAARRGPIQRKELVACDSTRTPPLNRPTMGIRVSVGVRASVVALSDVRLGLRI